MHGSRGKIELGDLINLFNNESKISTYLACDELMSSREVTESLEEMTQTEWSPDERSVRNSLEEFEIFGTLRQVENKEQKKGEPRVKYGPSQNHEFFKQLALNLLVESTSYNYNLQSFFGKRNTANWERDSVPLARLKTAIHTYLLHDSDLSEDDRKYLEEFSKLDLSILKKQKAELAKAGFLIEPDNTQTYTVSKPENIFTQGRNVGKYERKIQEYILENSRFSTKDLMDTIEGLKERTAQNILTKLQRQKAIKKNAPRTKDYKLEYKTTSLLENVLIPLIAHYRGKKIGDFELAEVKQSHLEGLIQDGLKLYKNISGTTSNTHKILADDLGLFYLKGTILTNIEPKTAVAISKKRGFPDETPIKAKINGEDVTIEPAKGITNFSDYNAMIVATKYFQNGEVTNNAKKIGLQKFMYEKRTQKPFPTTIGISTESMEVTDQTSKELLKTYDFVGCHESTTKRNMTHEQIKVLKSLILEGNARDFETRVLYSTDMDKLPLKIDAKNFRNCAKRKYYIL